MVFTIVTIIFLPMSFIASCFSIDISDWGTQLTIGYVSKYMFGIGLAISFIFVAMAFLVHDISAAWKAVLGVVKSYTGCLRRGPRPQHESEDEDEKQHPDDVSTWTVRATKPGSAGAASTTGYRWHEDVDWKRRGLEGPDDYSRLSHDRVRYDHARLGLSPIRYGGDKVSIRSGGQGIWSRPSRDGRRGRLSEDLERGRVPPGLG